MLGTIMTFVGLIAIVGGIYLLYRKFSQQTTIVNTTLAIFLLIIGLATASFKGLAFYAEPGYSYLVQYPTGKQIAVLTPGYHFRYFGDVIPFKKYLTVKFSDSADVLEYSGKQEQIPVRFNDAVEADVGLSVRVQLPTKPESFKKLALDFRSQENFLSSSVIPAIKEVVRNSARMYSAQEYITGRGGAFENAVLDQLTDGIYILVINKKIEYNDTEDFFADDEEQRNVKQKENIKDDVEIKRDSNGNKMRKKHPFKEYNIYISQATIETVETEEKFNKMIGLQRDAAAQTNIIKQETQKAIHNRQKIIQEGETKKAEIRIIKEQEQIQQLIEKETQQKAAEIEKKKAQIEFETEKIRAETKRTLADAEAYKRQVEIEANNALEQRLSAYIEVNRVYAEALGKQKSLVPQIVIGNSGSGEGQMNSINDFINLLMANQANQLAVDLNFDNVQKVQKVQKVQNP